MLRKRLVTKVKRIITLVLTVAPSSYDVNEISV